MSALRLTSCSAHDNCVVRTCELAAPNAVHSKRPARPSNVFYICTRKVPSTLAKNRFSADLPARFYKRQASNEHSEVHTVTKAEVHMRLTDAVQQQYAEQGDCSGFQMGYFKKMAFP